MLQNISWASPVAASTATRTLGRSTRSSWPCETFASSSRSLSLKDCDCAVMRASIRHLLLSVVVRRIGGEGSVTEYRSGERGAVPDGATEYRSGERGAVPDGATEYRSGERGAVPDGAMEGTG